MTATLTTAQVYLHPAAATSTIAVRAIQHVTGRIACIHPNDSCIRLVTPAEHRALNTGYGREVRHG